MLLRSVLLSFSLFSAVLLSVNTPASEPPEPTEKQLLWLDSVLNTWAEQDKEFKSSSTSPLAGLSRFEITEIKPVFFVENEGALQWSLKQYDQSKFSFKLSDKGWQWSNLSATVNAKRDDKKLDSGATLAAGDILSVGRFTVEVYPTDTRITVLVFDGNSQKVKDFKSLHRFDPDDKYAVTATIDKFDSAETVELITGRQKIKQRFRYARLKFNIDGVDLVLTAYKNALDGEHSKMLFIPFTDKTTGKYSYGGGRYLMVDEPAQGNEVEIDFNRVTNPFCSYADIYNCIVPTRENRLPIEILAGEKKYH